jgi:hypothetical protein
MAQPTKKDDMLTERRRLLKKLQEDIVLMSEYKDFKVHDEDVCDENKIFNVVYYGLLLFLPTILDRSRFVEKLIECCGNVYMIEGHLDKHIQKNIPSIHYAYCTKRYREGRGVLLKPASIGELAVNMALDSPDLHDQPEPSFADRAAAVAFLLTQGRRLAEMHGTEPKDLEKYKGFVDDANFPKKLPSELVLEAAVRKRTRA